MKNMEMKIDLKKELIKYKNIFAKIRKFERQAIKNVGVTGNIVNEFYDLYFEKERKNLRLVELHFSSTSSAEFLNVSRRFINDNEFREKLHQFIFELYLFANYVKKRYSYAIPNEEILQIILQYSPIIEIGAGKGYWGFHLSKIGADILCFDEYPRDLYWYSVNKGNCTILKNYKRRTLLLCYPFGNMALKCIKQYKGSFLLYVGDIRFEITANFDFQNYLLDNFKLKMERKTPTLNIGKEQNYLQVWERI